jgi:Domain of unknown function (DUF4124)
MNYRRWLGKLAGVAAMMLVNQSDLADDMYKTVDPQGHVVYSDHPLSSASQRMSVQVTAPNTQEAARITKEQTMLNADAAQQAQQAKRDADEQTKEAAQDATQRRRCESARDRYAVFAAGGRIFKSDAQGNRVYYSDQEIEEQRVAAKAVMDSTCQK